MALAAAGKSDAAEHADTTAGVDRVNKITEATKDDATAIMRAESEESPQVLRNQRTGSVII